MVSENANEPERAMCDKEYCEHLKFCTGHGLASFDYHRRHRGKAPRKNAKRGK